MTTQDRTDVEKWFEKACEQRALRMTAEAAEESLRGKVATLERQLAEAREVIRALNTVEPPKISDLRRAREWLKANGGEK
jgi:hypothetical protein